MRPPRYRFPDEVRSTTRGIASQMLREGTVARTPEDFERWIAQHPEVRETLETGGYGTAFTAEDLFPLLEVFVTRAAGAASEAEAPLRFSRVHWLAAGLLLLVLGAVLLLLVGATQAGS
jgi:ferric-dicitrate binding protein FerR (iron transport regulator)